MKYFKCKKDYVLVFGEGKLEVTGYTDADFQSDLNNRASTSRYVFILNGKAVSWCNTKQQCIGDSTCETEYATASEASKEVIWIRDFILEPGSLPALEAPIPLYYNNMGTILHSEETKRHNMLKHAKRKYYTIRDFSTQKRIVARNNRMSENVADPFTKPLNKMLFSLHISGMGLKYIPM